MKVTTAITVFGNPFRLRRIFEAFDITGWPEDLVVVEDKSNDVISAGYADICASRNVRHYRMPEWGCMQGSAQAMMEQTDSEWVIYHGDDLMPSDGAIKNAEGWCQALSGETYEKHRIGAIQLPYWNYEDLFVGRMRDDQFSNEDLSWLSSVPHNPHWWGPAYYVNVNGAAFALRRKAWQASGGFPTKTWCLDEHISCRLWLFTDWTIVSVPGAPFVHAGGMSTPDQFENGHAHHGMNTLEAWYSEWGRPPDGDKNRLGERCRRRMHEESAKTGLVAR